jgi:hypothetical protein
MEQSRGNGLGSVLDDTFFLGSAELKGKAV